MFHPLPPALSLSPSLPASLLCRGCTTVVLCVIAGCTIGAVLYLRVAYKSKLENSVVVRLLLLLLCAGR